MCPKHLFAGQCCRKALSMAGPSAGLEGQPISPPPHHLTASPTPRAAALHLLDLEKTGRKVLPSAQSLLGGFWAVATSQGPCQPRWPVTSPRRPFSRHAGTPFAGNCRYLIKCYPFLHGGSVFKKKTFLTSPSGFNLGVSQVYGDKLGYESWGANQVGSWCGWVG